MKKNQKIALVAIGVAAVAWFLWKRKKDEAEKKPSISGTASTNNPIFSTRPMIIGKVA